MIKKYILATTFVLSSCFSTLSVAESFTVKDIHFEGLQRVTVGAALLSLPIVEGDIVDDYQLSNAMKILYSSKYFDSIELIRDRDIIKFKVIERPTISSIELTGNKKLKDEQILDSLKSSGIRVGESLDRTTINKIEKDLENFYHSIGKYSAQVKAEIKELPRNRIELDFSFKEGLTAKIKQINIVGNNIFSDEQLTKILTLSETGGWWDFFADDKYQKQKLSGDLEVIKSYYLDRGYIRFRLDNTQVALAPSKKDVYVTVNLTEGDVYSISDVKFLGNLLGYDKEIKSLVPFKNGDLYSGSDITFAEQSIKKFLGRLGYAYPKIVTYPEIDDETNTVVINFSVEPGQRGYVRHINISGNLNTKDNVIRREMRQMESSWLSSENIEQSKTRLNKLGFFSSVEIEPIRISNDLVDLNVTVEEQPSGSVNLGLGYGSEGGFSVNTGISQSNFLGTGDKVGISAKVNQSSKVVDLNYLTPYLTKDGVSGGGNIYFKKYNADKDDLIDYTSTTYGIQFNSGFPINEFNRLNFGLGWENKGITQNEKYEQLNKFWNIYSSMKDSDDMVHFQGFNFTARWSRNTLDKGQLATQGMKHSLSAKVTVPGSDLQYYKIDFDIKNYQRITDDGSWTTLLRGTASYGNGYGDFEGTTQILPFFENFYAGGYRTIRGFKNNSVSPHAMTLNTTTDQITMNSEAVGGNARYSLSAELIFPVPFLDESYTRQIRSSLFVDAGEAWDTEYDHSQYSGKTCISNCEYFVDYSKPGRIRASLGVQFSWNSPMGPLVLTFAKPIKSYEGDETEIFTFNIGDTF